MKGSELEWLGWYWGSVDSPRFWYNILSEVFRYNAFQPAVGINWKPEDFDFDRDYKRFGITEGLYSAVNPDLREFKSAGGKLIAYVGWNDMGAMPLVTTDYYQTVEKTLGGRSETQDFFRLFVVPGMNHSIGGDGAWAVDWLNYLEGWVERGQAPEKVVGAHLRIDDLKPDSPDFNRQLTRRMRFPLEASKIEFYRPVYPYPTTIKYLGNGKLTEAASFGPIEH
jgi:feruloyl esterase